MLFGLPIATVKAIAFWAFVIAFAVKVPVWPFHTWLPDAHTEAPTAGSMILAGVLLKLGAYGFLRLVLPLFPAESHTYAVWLGVLAVAAIVFGAFSAAGQKDFKRLVAYSSINHMGFVVLAIAAAAYVGGSTDEALRQSATIAVNGAVLQMFNHGLSAAGMFFLVGVLYDRTHTRLLENFGGLFAILPVYGSILSFMSMASLGLPGLNGFVSEFMIVRGTWPIFTAFTAISMLGLLFTGVYVLKAIKLVLHGRIERAMGWKSERNFTARNHCCHPLDPDYPFNRDLAGMDCGCDQPRGDGLVMRSLMQIPWLSILILLPLATGVALLAIPAGKLKVIRWLSLAYSTGHLCNFGIAVR